MLSCAGKAPDTRYQPMVKEIEEIKKHLPYRLDDESCLINVEYEDSTFSQWFEIDDVRLYSLFLTDSLQQMFKKTTLFYTVSMSEGQNRHNYEIIVEQNIRIRSIYIGKNSQKQIEIIITPNEINESLHTQVDTNTRLSMLINFWNIMIPEDEEGVSRPIVTLKDSIVYLSFTIDENILSPTALKNNLDRSEIIMDICRADPRLIIYTAKEKCGLCYRFIGSQSKKIVDINFSSHEIWGYKNLIELSTEDTEIVECDI